MKAITRAYFRQWGYESVIWLQGYKIVERNNFDEKDTNKKVL